MSKIYKGHDKNDYFEYGKIKIIIREHFSDTRKTFDDIIGEYILRQARNEKRAYDERMNDDAL